MRSLLYITMKADLNRQISTFNLRFRRNTVIRQKCRISNWPRVAYLVLVTFIHMGSFRKPSFVEPQISHFANFTL